MTTHRTNFWDLIETRYAGKSLAGIADELGTGKSAVIAMKSGVRGASVQVAKKATFGTPEKACNAYLHSQLRALETKLATKAIAPENTLAAVTPIMKAVSGQFRPEEIRRDAEFKAAAERLMQIAQAALESFGPAEQTEPVHATGDSVEAALKAELDAEDGKVTRDVHGRAMPQGEKVERDAHGRAIR